MVGDPNSKEASFYRCGISYSNDNGKSSITMTDISIRDNINVPSLFDERNAPGDIQQTSAGC